MSGKGETEGKKCLEIGYLQHFFLRAERRRREARPAEFFPEKPYPPDALPRPSQRPKAGVGLVSPKPYRSSLSALSRLKRTEDWVRIVEKLVKRHRLL